MSDNHVQYDRWPANLPPPDIDPDTELPKKKESGCLLTGGDCECELTGGHSTCEGVHCEHMNPSIPARNQLTMDRMLYPRYRDNTQHAKFQDSMQEHLDQHYQDYRGREIDMVKNPNAKLSFIAWAKLHGVVIKPIAHPWPNPGSAHRHYLYEITKLVKQQIDDLMDDHYRMVCRTDTFHGAMQVACTAIFGKL